MSRKFMVLGLILTASLVASLAASPLRAQENTDSHYGATLMTSPSHEIHNWDPATLDQMREQMKEMPNPIPDDFDPSLFPPVEPPTMWDTTLGAGAATEGVSHAGHDAKPLIRRHINSPMDQDATDSPWPARPSLIAPGGSVAGTASGFEIFSAPLATTEHEVAQQTRLERVSEPWRQPWSRNAKVFIWWSNGRLGACSASMISPQHALFAAHCLYHRQAEAWADVLLVIPGYEDGYAPYGAALAKETMYWKAFKHGNGNYDMAVMTLDRPIGCDSGWFGLAALSCSTARSSTLHSVSYPGERYSGAYPYYRRGPVDHCASPWIHEIDNEAFGGMSGSGLHWLHNNNRYAMAVVVYKKLSPPKTGAVRIDVPKLEVILDYMYD